MGQYHMDPDFNSKKSQFEYRIRNQLVIWLKDQLDKGYTSKYIYEVHINYGWRELNMDYK